MHLGDADLFGQVADLALAVAGDDERPGDAMAGAQVADEGFALGAGLVAEAEGGQVLAVAQGDAFEATLRGREELQNLREGFGEFFAAGHLVGVAIDHAAEAFPRFLADLHRLGKGNPGCRGGLDHGGRQRMARIALETGDTGQRLLGCVTRGREGFDQSRLAVGEGAGLVENGHPAGGNFFQGHRVLDDDAPAGCERNGANDRDRNADQQRAGCGDDQHGQEPGQVARLQPGQQGDGDGDGRVDGPELVAQAADGRTGLLGFPHDLHDFGVTGVDRFPVGADGEGPLPVDSAGENTGTGRLGQHVGLACEVGFVHGAVAVEHRAIDGACLVGEDDQVVADLDLVEGDIAKSLAGFLVGDRGQAFCQGFQREGGSSDRVGLQSLPA